MTSRAAAFHRPPRPQGFTLIELVVVMAVIALLLTISLPRYFHSLDNGRNAVQRQNIATIRDAIDKFYGDQGRFPDALEELVARRYLREVPLDPVSELRNWVIVAPPDAALPGAVYDVRPADQAGTGVAAAAASGAKP
jgi:general secretion pathway protein G